MVNTYMPMICKSCVPCPRSTSLKTLCFHLKQSLWLLEISFLDSTKTCFEFDTNYDQVDQTSTFVWFFIHSATDMSNFYVDRVITITGSVEACSKAEALLSEKMRKCLEQDAQSYNVS